MALGVGIPSLFQQQAKAPSGTKAQDAYLVSESQRRADPYAQYGSAKPGSSTGYGPIQQYNAQQKYNPSVPLPFNPTAGMPESFQTGLPNMPNDAYSTLLQQAWEMNYRRQKDWMDANEAEVRAGAGASQARIGLQREGLDVTRGGLDRQIPLLDELFGYREGQRAGEKTYLDKISKQTQGDYDNAMKVLDDTLVSLGIDINVAKSSQQSQATAMGAVVSQGNRDVLTDLDRKHVEGQKAIENKRYEAGSARNRQMASIEKNYSDLAFQAKIDKATTAEDKAKIYDQYKMLDLQARELDISSGQVAAQLDAALRKSRSNYAGLDDLLGALTSGDPGQIKAAQEFWRTTFAQGSS